MRRSYKLIVDTHKLSETLASGMQAIALDTESKNFHNIYSNEISATAASSSSSAETDSRMRILKDSSKDFLTPYNPNAGSSKEANSESTSRPKVIVKGNSLLHMTLTKSNPSSSVMSESLQYLSQSIVLAVMGAFFVFLVVLVLVFIFTRATRKQLPEVSPISIDKEVLIQRELLPEHTAPMKSAEVQSSAKTENVSTAALHV